MVLRIKLVRMRDKEEIAVVKKSFTTADDGENSRTKYFTLLTFIAVGCGMRRRREKR